MPGNYTAFQEAWDEYVRDNHALEEAEAELEKIRESSKKSSQRDITSEVLIPALEFKIEKLRVWVKELDERQNQAHSSAMDIW